MFAWCHGAPRKVTIGVDEARRAQMISETSSFELCACLGCWASPLPALPTGGKFDWGNELLCLLLEISWGGAVRIQRTEREVLLFTLLEGGCIPEKPVEG